MQGDKPGDDGCALISGGATDQVVAVPAQPVTIKSTTCAASGKINIHFAKNVAYAPELAVVVADENGKAMATKIKTKANSLLSVQVTGMTKGAKYTATIVSKSKNKIVVKVNGAVKKGKSYKLYINGVRVKGASNFGALTTSFKVK